MTRDLAVIAHAAEIIEREAARVKFVSRFLDGTWEPNWAQAEHADMLATAKALRAMIDEGEG